MIYDFHTHSSFSDGQLSPMELIHRAVRNGYKAIALTDHAGIGEVERFVSEISKNCSLAEKYWNIRAIPGVELTHLPPAALADAARFAKEKGAQIVIVHGETIVEPVERGTNRAAAECPYVDILAHPGLLTADEARAAKANGIFLEISARKGHSLTNGHVVNLCRNTGAGMLLGSDAHDEGDLLTVDFARAVARGAGLAGEEIEQVLEKNPGILLEKCLRK